MTSRDVCQMTWRSAAAPLLAIAISLLPIARITPDVLWGTIDFRAHVFRLLTLQSSIAGGMLYPRWMPDLLYGLGYPLFDYYSPASYYLALAAALCGMTTVDAMVALTAITFPVGGLGCYLLARRHLGLIGSLIACAVYVFWPYRFVVAFVRGDVPELMALALAPWCFWALDKLASTPSRPILAAAASLVALLILTHNVTALLCAPWLVLWVWFAATAEARRDWRGLFRLSGALVTGLGLAAVFWIPALADTRLLHRERLFAGDYASSLTSLAGLFKPVDWAYHYFPANDNLELTFPPGFLILVLVGIGALASLLSRRRNRAEDSTTATRPSATFPTTMSVLLVAWTALSLAAMLRALAPVLAPLEIIQAPYRLLGPMAIPGALLVGTTASLGSTSRARTVAVARIGAAVVLIPLVAASATVYLAPKPDQAPASPSLADLYSFESAWCFPGTTWEGEFVPSTVAVDPFGILGWHAPAQSAETVQATRSAGVRVVHWEAGDRGLLVDAPVSTTVSLRSTYFRGWTVTVDDAPAQALAVGDLGLLGARVPPGTHLVRFRFGTTTVTVAGAIVSLSALILLLASPAWLWRGDRSRRDDSRIWRRVGSIVIRLPLLLVGATTIAIVSNVIPLSRPIPETGLGIVGRGDAPVVDFGDSFRLLDARLDSANAVAGESLGLTFYWEGIQPTRTDYSIFVHVLDGNNRAVAQKDAEPIFGFGHTSSWISGEVVRDHWSVNLPGDARPGRYRVLIGLYDRASGSRLGVKPIDSSLAVDAPDGNSLVVGTLEIRGSGPTVR